MTKLKIAEYTLQFFDLPDGILVEGDGQFIYHLKLAIQDKTNCVFGLNSVAFLGYKKKDVLKLIEKSDHEENIIQLDPPIKEIPVYYDKNSADVLRILELLDIDFQTLVDLHNKPTYELSMYGFLPGFTYLKGNVPRIHLPRKDIPSRLIPAGSVAISGNMTGIYPVDSPGGWHVIGRCPIKMFSGYRDPMFLLDVGDKVCFKSISKEEFDFKREYE
jgi:KipI family sensor histidine kinase inhibitor